MSKMTSSRALCMICAGAWTSLHFISHLSFMELKNFEFEIAPSSRIIDTSSLNSRLEMRLQRFNSSIPNISNHVEFQSSFPRLQIFKLDSNRTWILSNKNYRVFGFSSARSSTNVYSHMLAMSCSDLYLMTADSLSPLMAKTALWPPLPAIISPPRDEELRLRLRLPSISGRIWIVPAHSKYRVVVSIFFSNYEV